MDFKAQIDELGLSGQIFTYEGRTLFHGQDHSIIDHGPNHPTTRYVAMFVQDAVAYKGCGNTIEEALVQAVTGQWPGGDIEGFPGRACLTQFTEMIKARGFEVNESFPVGWTDDEGEPLHLYHFGPRNGKGRYQVEVFPDASWQVTTKRNGHLWQGAGNSLDEALDDLSLVRHQGQGMIARLLAKFGL